MRRLFFLLALGNLLAAGWVIGDEVATRRPWKAVQADANRRLRARGEAELAVEIRQTAAAEPDGVDRCVTCHLGIDTPRPGWDATAPPHLRLHPRQGELLGPHPVERFGCTACHDGQGTQTKGVARAAFDHGRDDPYWERPLRSPFFVQASCLGCHDLPPAGAPLLARGRALFGDMRCGGCHVTSFVPPTIAASAPPLDGLTGKSSRAFVESWLRDPRAVRPDTRMPGFWPPPVGADGRPLPDGDPAVRAAAVRRDDEIAAIVDFLASLPPRPLPAVALPAAPGEPALVASGRTLFESLGCRGCHRLTPEPATATGPVPDERRQGPLLDRVGEKATAAWLAAWLRAPGEVSPTARMPSFRLRASEIAALVAFLVAERRPGAPAAAPDWPARSGARVDEGRRLVGLYGCQGCHDLPSLPRAGRPGPDLDAFGDKTPDEVTFGDAAPDCGRRTRLECFALEKLRTPRRFVGGGVERLLMPDYGLSADDALALAVFVTAQRTRRSTPALRRPATADDRALADGEDVLRHFNCRGCHEIGRTLRPAVVGGAGAAVPAEPEWVPEGGALRALMEDPATGPPPLTFAGAKFRSPWLAEFLRAPGPIRPWLTVRMPTFPFTAPALDAVARSFAVRNGAPYPDLGAAGPVLPAAGSPAEARRLFDKLMCSKCHPSAAPAGAGLARAGGAGTTHRAAPPLAPSDLAPDLALVPGRLRPAWVRAWIADPQAFDAETRMPAYFAPLPPEHPGLPSHLGGLPDFAAGDGDAQVAMLVWLLYQR